MATFFVTRVIVPRRNWDNNDTVQVNLPLSFWTASIDEKHKDTVALMRGSIMLVALDSGLQISQKAITSLKSLKPTAHAASWFELPPPDSSVRLLPFYAVEDETYRTYFTWV